MLRRLSRRLAIELRTNRSPDLARSGLLFCAQRLRRLR
ncbi:hypothetical protein PLANPX_5833 [Lacipirellula parvula]|uniref:Uncharacterized protein n=1 Tax=Lacipirellula parvula TaxID=2650471 RepID=A0A5K7XLK6_9BACT|nr:hypothetical protein PLANPX_5833 [Lacipirellula parvula]